MIATENVQGKEAIVLIVAVKEAAQLMAVDRVIGGIEVEHDPLRRLRVGLEEEVHPQVLHGVRVTSDLLVATLLVGTDRGQFEPVEGALAGQGFAPVTPSNAGLAGGI